MLSSPCPLLSPTWCVLVQSGNDQSKETPLFKVARNGLDHFPGDFLRKKRQNPSVCLSSLTLFPWNAT